MLPQQTQRGSVQRAARHQGEHLRVIAAHPRRRDVSTRRRLTQPEFLHAILEQRRKPEIEKQLPLVQLRQVRQKLSRDLVTPPDDARKPRQKLVAARTRPVAQTFPRLRLQNHVPLHAALDVPSSCRASHLLLAALSHESRHSQRRARLPTRTVPPTAVGAPRWPQASAWASRAPAARSARTPAAPRRLTHGAPYSQEPRDREPLGQAPFGCRAARRSNGAARVLAANVPPRRARSAAEAKRAKRGKPIRRWRAACRRRSVVRRARPARPRTSS